MEKHSNLAQVEVESMTSQRQSYLNQALQYYCKALQQQASSSQGCHHDLRVFRLVSLWFANMDSEAVNELLTAEMKEIPSYKFTGLFYQLCARMVSKSTQGVHSKSFPKLLYELIRRCANDHPYHILPTILAMANSNADEVEMKAQASTSSGSGKTSRPPVSGGAKESDDDDRAYTAKLILEKLKRNSDAFRQIVERMALVADALIKLAYLPLPPNQQPQVPVAMPEGHLLTKVVNFEDVPIPTVELNVSSCGGGGGQYPVGSFPAIAKFRHGREIVFLRK